VAVLLLVVGLLGVARAAGELVRHQTRAAALAEMTLLAQDRFDALRVASARKTLDTLGLVVGGSILVSQANRADTVMGGSGRRYIRRWAVTAGQDGARVIALRVAPLIPGRQLPANLDFSTIISPPPQ
jgi:hypothetical protein